MAAAAPTVPSTSSTTLADLQALFQSELQAAGQLAITEANSGVPGLTALLNQTIGPNLVISNAALSLSDSTLTVTGLLQFLGTGFSVSLAFTQAGSGFSLAFGALQAANTSLSLIKVLAQVAPSVTNAPSVALSNLQITFDTAASTFLLGATFSWTFSLASTSATVLTTFALSSSSATLSGTLGVGSATFNVAYQLQKGAQTLSGSWSDSAHPLGWDSIVSALGLNPALNLPVSLPSAGFQAAQFSLDFSSGDFSLTGQTSNGAAFLLATKSNGQWGFAVGAAVASNWTFSQLTSSLAPLDFLSFQQAYLLVSSFTKTGFAFPNFALMTTPLNVVPGLNFGASVNFVGGTSPLAKAVYSIVQASSASVQGSIGTLQNTQLSASLGGALVIPPTKNLQLKNPALVVNGNGPTVQVQGTLEIPVHNAVIDLIGKLQVSPERADFAVDVKFSSLPTPFGFTGVTLLDIGGALGIGFTPPSFFLELGATFQIGNTAADSCALAFEVLGEAINPTLLYGKFTSLSFPTVLSAMFPMLAIPDALKVIGLQNVFVYYCEQPGQSLPDGTSVAPGFALSGTLNAYAFTLAAALKIDFGTGISGSAAMTPIHLKDNAVSITGSGPLGGPAVSFSTTGPTYFAVTLDVTVLDVVGVSVAGLITNSGFSFTLAIAGGNNFNASLMCNFTDSHNFSGSAKLAFNINLTVGPFTAPKTGVNLGSLHINTSFNGNLALTVTSASIQGSVNGTFDGRTLPSASFNVSTASLKNIPKMVMDQISSQAQSIYSDVLSDAKKWAGMVSSGAITGADDAAKVLTGYFGQSQAAATAILQQFKLHGSTTLHADTTTGHVDVPAVHADVPTVHTDTTSPHIDVPTLHSDTSTPHVDGSRIGIHGDIKGIHSDTTVTPHGDSRPHVDTQITPHGDTNTPHGDTNPHADTSVHIDV